MRFVCEPKHATEATEHCGVVTLQNDVVIADRVSEQIVAQITLSGTENYLRAAFLLVILVACEDG